MFFIPLQIPFPHSCLLRKRDLSPKSVCKSHCLPPSPFRIALTTPILADRGFFEFEFGLTRLNKYSESYFLVLLQPKASGIKPIHIPPVNYSFSFLLRLIRKWYFSPFYPIRIKEGDQIRILKECLVQVCWVALNEIGEAKLPLIFFN